MELEVSIRKELRDFDLQADFAVKDEVFALLGASGCGKSMTLKCIAGIERPDEGRIVLNGRTLFDSKQGIDLPPQQRRVGYLFQNYALFPNMTIAENILFGAVGTEAEKKAKIAKISGFSAHADKQELCEWLETNPTKPRHVFVTHGEVRAAHAFARLVKEKFGWVATVPKYETVATLR